MSGDADSEESEGRSEGDRARWRCSKRKRGDEESRAGAQQSDMEWRQDAGMKDLAQIVYFSGRNGCKSRSSIEQEGEIGSKNPVCPCMRVCVCRRWDTVW